MQKAGDASLTGNSLDCPVWEREGAKGFLGDGGGSGDIELSEGIVTAPSDPFPNRAGNFPALLMSPSWPRRGWEQEKTFPLRGRWQPKADGCGAGSAEPLLRAVYRFPHAGESEAASELLSIIYTGVRSA